MNAKNHPKNNATNTTPARNSLRYLAALALLVLAVHPVLAQQISWTNADTAWPPGATQEWSIGSNWAGNTAPGSSSFVVLTRWTGSENVAAFTLLDSVTNIPLTYRSGFGSKLHIASSGNLRLLGVNQGVAANDGRVAIGAQGGSGDYVSIASGGQISWVDPDDPVGGTPTQGYLALSNNATLDTAGTIIAPIFIGVGLGSTMNITGGIIEAKRTFDAVLVTGSLNQSGGAIRDTPQLRLDNGTYTISGGSVSITGTNGLYFRHNDLTATTGSTIHVDGSGAASISFNGIRYQADNDRNNATWKFTLDNGTNHITPVTLTANGNNGATLRNGATLAVGLNGGVLLSDANQFMLIDRPTGTYTDTWGTGPGSLWTNDAANVDGSNKIRITLAGSGLASLDAATVGASVGFAASSAGYINLTGLSGLETNLQLKLNWSDQSTANISDFTTLLTAGGLNWWEISSNEIGLSLNPSVSGGNYFAWDLQGIGSDGMLDGITVIPEPSSLLLVGLTGLLLLVFGQRRRMRG